MRSSIICENAYSRLSNIPVIPFGVSVNPIPTWWDNYAHRITACPSRFENLTASLYTLRSLLNEQTELSEQGGIFLKNS